MTKRELQQQLEQARQDKERLAEVVKPLIEWERRLKKSRETWAWDQGVEAGYGLAAFEATPKLKELAGI